MDGLHKNVSSSSTPFKTHSISRGIDENEESYGEMGLNLQNSRKPTTKNYMSPTISAASKINPPRKKILAERNESLDNSLQTKAMQKPTSLDSKSISSTEFDYNEQKALVDDLSSRPYDPLTNSPSPTPRPKFLRYKPNRRQELFLKRENQPKEGNDAGNLEMEKGINSEGNLVSSCGSLATGFNDANGKQDHKEMDESEDEFEEVYEERGWGLFRDTLQILVLLTVLVFSTSYISSMNSPTAPPVVQAVMSLKDGYHMIQDHVCAFVKSLESAKYLVDREGTRMILVDSNRIEEEMIEGVKLEEAENSDGLNEVVEMVEDEVEGAEDELIEGGENEDMELVEHGEKEIVDKDDVFKVQAGESADASDLELEISDKVAANSGLLQGPEAPELIRMALTNESSVPNTSEKENEMVSEPVREEIFGREMGRIGNFTDDCDDHETLTRKEGLIKHMETESILKAVIGFSVISSVLASLVFAIHFRKNRTARKDTRQVVKPCFDSLTAEKCCSLLANEEDKVEHTEHPVSLANSRSLTNSLEEDSKKTYESRAPTIELLGELVVGEMSSSLRSCGMKSRTIESEVSSYSVSMEKKGLTSNKANSVPVRMQPALSHISNINFPSYTDEKEIVKKEEVTSPLRRSSRIRNRAIASP